jgi:hypothetical protein
MKIIATIICLLISCAIGFLLTAGLLWCVFWALAALNIVTIVWTWKMAFAIWILLMAIKWLF